MTERRWFNPSLPQTLQIAVMLLYLNGAFLGLEVLLNPPGGFWLLAFAAVTVGHFLAGQGIASEQRFGYRLGIAMALFPFVLRLLVYGIDGLLGGSILNLMFEIALVALLLHPQSQEHQRIWFR